MGGEAAPEKSTPPHMTLASSYRQPLFI